MHSSILKYDYTDAWLGLGPEGTQKLRNVISIEHNPLYLKGPSFDDLGVRELLALSNIRYVGYAAKLLCGIDLPPFQMVIQQQLANHAFPMLIGCRGIGKTYSLGLNAVLTCLLRPNSKVILAGAAFRQSKSIFEYSEKIVKESPMIESMLDFSTSRQIDSWTMRLGSSTIVAIPIGCLSPDSMITTNKGIYTLGELKNKQNIQDYKVWSNGKWSSIGYFYNSGVSECWKVTTKRGYSYKGTPNHKMKIVRDDNIVWSRTDELKIGDRILIDRTPRWHEASAVFSNDEAYVLGAMIGDGSYCNKGGLKFTTKDKFIINKIEAFVKKSPYPKKMKSESDGVHYNFHSRKLRNWFLEYFGISPHRAINKVIPSKILCSSKDNIVNFIKGLFDADGSVVNISKNCSRVVFTNTSKVLCEQLQFILTHFGIISKLTKTIPKNKNWNIRYDIIIEGAAARLYMAEIGFGLDRKNNKFRYSTRTSPKTDFVPISKDILLKNNITNSHILRKKNYTFNYCEQKIKKYNVSEIDILCNRNYFYDEVVSIEKQIDQPMYDINVPDGNEYTGNCFFSHNSGEKIRGLRATNITIDEYASHNPEIVDEVITGFAAIGSDPVKSLQHRAAIRAAQELDIDPTYIEASYSKRQNSIILSGTAEYYFNHFYGAWKKHCSIIKAGDDKEKLHKIFGEDIPPTHDSKQYCVIRIPYSALPEDYMDDQMISRAKAQMPRSLYLKEYEAVFVEDSDGFFRRKLIEECVASAKNIDKGILPKYCTKPFEGMAKGDSEKVYVFGIDPAAKNDNFAVIILEVHPEHSRIVHCWTTNEKDFIAKKRNMVTEETDYYAYCVRKVRDLMRVFPTRLIGVDAQGGGFAIQEAFKKMDNLKDGELPIYETINHDKPKDTDDLNGHHFLTMVQFANAAWLHDANWGLRGDFESKTLLFPYYDPISSELSIVTDKIREDEFSKRNPGKELVIYDSLEDVLRNIEELKDELSNIVYEKTNAGREKWDVPDIKINRHTKGSGKKDRYSALLIANFLARQARVNLEVHKPYETYGGFVRDIPTSTNSQESGMLYSGPSWFTEKL